MLMRWVVNALRFSFGAKHREIRSETRGIAATTSITSEKYKCGAKLRARHDESQALPVSGQRRSLFIRNSLWRVCGDYRNIISELHELWCAILGLNLYPRDMMAQIHRPELQ